MNRVYSGFFAIAIALFALFTLNLFTAQSAALQQDEPDEAVEAVLLSQPVRVELKQQVPISVTLSQSAASTETESLTETVTITLDFGVEILVTHAPTASNAATVTVILTRANGITLPFTLVVANLPAAEVAITPLPVPEPPTVTEALTVTTPLTSATEITSTETITAVEPITTTPTVTETEVVTAGEGVTIPVISTTTTVTANLRSGPSTDFPISNTVSAGTPINIAAVSPDGLWYLLDNAQWIFNTLIVDPPQNAPEATPELIDAVTQAAAETAARQALEAEEPPEVLPTDTPTPTVTAPLSPTVTITESTATTETTPITDSVATTETVPITDEAPVPTVNVDANLRSGPSTDLPVIGGTITGDEIDIVGQNSDGTWYLLSNGGWVSAPLVDNPPFNVPVVPDDAVETSAAQPFALPTPTPAPSAQAPATELTDEETGYLRNVRSLVSRYKIWSNALTSGVIEATNNLTLLQDPNWVADIDNGVEALTQIGASIRDTDPPAFFAAGHIDLVEAAASFDGAATLLTDGLADSDIQQLQQGIAELDLGSTLAERSLERLSELAQ